METNHHCYPDWVYEPIEDSYDRNGNLSEHVNHILNSTTQYSNYTSDENEINEQNNKPDTTEYHPHLDESLGWYAESEEEDEDNCNKLKLWGTTFNDTHTTTRIYKNAMVSDTDRYTWKKLTGNSDWPLIEESIYFSDDGYEYKVTLPDTDLKFSGSVKNESDKTIIHLSSILTLDMEIDPNNTERFKTKLRWGYEKIFDGWFYDIFGYSKQIINIVHKMIPDYLKPYLDMARSKEWHSYLLFLFVNNAL